MNEVAHGEISIGLKDDATGGLRRIEAEYRAAMARIDRMEANAVIGADLAPLEARLKQARDKVRILDGMRAEPDFDADDEGFKEAYHEALMMVKRLDGEKATVEIETRGLTEALAAEEALMAAEKERAKTENDLAKKRLAQINKQAKVASALNKQREREAQELRRAEATAYSEDQRRDAKATADRVSNVNKVARTMSALNAQREREQRAAENEARRMNEQLDHAPLAAARQREQINRLTQEYRDATKEAERLDKVQPRPFFGRQGREARVELEVDRQAARLKMERIMEELRLMGAHPPVEIKVDTDRSDFSRARRTFLAFKDSLSDIGAKGLNAIGNVGSLRVLGNRLSTLVKVAAGLAPVLVDLGGAATALVGVLGTGLAGAAAIGGGALIGLGLNLGGVVASLHPMISDFKVAHAATQAYDKAVLQYGHHASQTIDAQAKMNKALKNVDPNAAQAARGLSKMSTQWADLTQKTTHRDVGQVLTSGFKMLDTVLPVVARNSNRSMDLISNSLDSVFTKIRANSNQRGGGILGSLGRSANQFLAPALDGLEHMGAALARIAESAARLFAGRTGQGFLQWAEGFDKSTRNSGKLDATITRLGNHAADLMHFFAALGRVLKDVFSGGADSGDRLVNTMTDALNRWDRFLSSDKGQESMADFFDRAATGAKALWGAIAPLIAAFVQWSSLLSPFTAGLLKGVGFVSNLVAGLTRVLGLGGPLAVLGATIGTAFAVSKIGSFVGMLARAVSYARELGAMGTLKSIFSGNFRSGMNSQAFAAGGTAAGAEIRTAMISGGTAAAAEIRGAMAVGGGLGAGEQALAGRAASGVILPPGAGRAAAQAEQGVGRAAGAFSRFRGAAAGAVTALTGFSPLAVAAGAAAVGLGYGIYKLATQEDDWANNERNAIAAHKQFLDAVRNTPQALNNAAQASLSYSQSTQAVTSGEHAVAQAQAAVNKLRRQGKTGTKEYKAATDNLRTANISYKQSLIDEYNQQQQLEAVNRRALKTRDTALTAANREHTERAQAVKDLENHSQSVQGLIRDYEKFGKAGQSIREFAESRPFVSDDMKAYLNALDDLKDSGVNAAHALDLFTLSGLNQQRAAAGLVPVADSAAAAVGRLSKSLGSTKVAKIALKFPDPKQAGSVLKGLDRAIQSGVPKSRAFDVVANSKSAEQALRRLNAIRLTPHNLEILEHGGDAAIKKLEQIAGRKLTKHELKIAQEGGPAVLALLEKIIRKRIPGKTFKIAQMGADTVISALQRIINKGIPNKSFMIRAIDRASSVVNHVASLLSGLHDKTTTLTTVHRDQYLHRARFAGGMIEARTHGAGFVERAAARAEAKPARRTTGGAYDTPTLLVGEEDRREYVIATNPAYRQRNVVFLKQAADDLGMVVVQPEANDYKIAPQMIDGGVQPAYSGVAAKRKHPRKPPKGGRAASPSTPGVAGTRGQTTHVGVPDPYSVGAVPEADVESVVGDFDRRVAAQEELWKRLRAQARADAIPKATHYATTTKDKHGKVIHRKGDVSNQTSIDNAKARHREHLDHMKAVREGGRYKLANGKWAPERYRTLGDPDHPAKGTLWWEDKQAKTDLQHIKHWNTQIGRLNARIDKDRTDMQTAASAYSRTGDPQYLEAWKSAKLDRDHAINNSINTPASAGGPGIKALLQQALDAAQKIRGLAKGAKGDSMDEWIDSLTGDISSASGEYESDLAEAAPTVTPADAPTLEQFIAGRGLTDQLGGLDKDYAVSQMNDVADDPRTSDNEQAASLADNATAAANLKDFYQNVYNTAVASGAPASIITEAANAFVGARDTLTQINEQISGGADTIEGLQYSGLAIDTERATALQQFGSNLGQVGVTGPSSMGMMAGMQTNPVFLGNPWTDSTSKVDSGDGGGSTVNVEYVNNYKYQPPDPHTSAASTAFELGALL